MGSHQIQSDLLVLDTPNYDVILGMNWLTKHSIYIDCAKLYVILYEETFSLITLPNTQIVVYNIELTVVDQI